MNEKQVRYLEELGPNLMKIIKRLLANQNLLRYLYYTDKDPLNPEKADVSAKEVYQDGMNGLIRIVPIIRDVTSATSFLTLHVLKGDVVSENNEYLDIYFSIETFTPPEQWAIKGENLRPYSIMSEIQKSLEDKMINGLGRIQGSGFSVNFFTEEMTAFVQRFRITQFR